MCKPKNTYTCAHQKTTYACVKNTTHACVKCAKMCKKCVNNLLHFFKEICLCSHIRIFSQASIKIKPEKSFKAETLT